MPEEPPEVARGEEREREKTKLYATTHYPKPLFTVADNKQLTHEEGRGGFRMR